MLANISTVSSAGLRSIPAVGVARPYAVPHKHRANSRGMEAELRADAGEGEPRLVEASSDVNLARTHTLRPLRRAGPVEYLTDRNAVDAVSRRDLLHHVPCLVLGHDGTLSLGRQLLPCSGRSRRAERGSWCSATDLTPGFCNQTIDLTSSRFSIAVSP